MNRSQHASTDYHESQQAINLKSHGNCFSATVLSTPLTGGINTTTLSTRIHLPRTESRNLQSLAPWLFSERLIQGRSAWCSGVSCPRSPLWSDFSLRASTIHPVAAASSVKARSPGLAQASPDEQQRRCCCLCQCLRATPTQQSLDQVFLQPLTDKPRRHGTTRLNTPNRSRWQSHSRLRTSVRTPGTLGWRYHDHTCANSSMIQQTASTTNTSTRTTHSTTSNTTSCAKLTVATWSARASKWLASALS